MAVTIAWARPRDVSVAWQFYAGDIAVRQLNSGVTQVKTDDGDWRDA
jgi:hypothetical protein